MCVRNKDMDSPIHIYFQKIALTPKTYRTDMANIPEELILKVLDYAPSKNKIPGYIPPMSVVR